MFLSLSTRGRRIENEVIQELRVDFKKHFWNYVTHNATIDWKRVPGVIVPTDRDMT